jgi:hypothetical protein
LLASGKYPLTDAAIEHWAADEEHGLAHGFCTAFLAWLALPDIRNTPLLSRVVATALLHDFARGAGLVEQGHDEGLREVFDKMNPPAYWHTAPQAEALLVYADRVELLVIRTAAGGLSQGRWTWRSNATPGFDRCWMVSTAGSVP